MPCCLADIIIKLFDLNIILHGPYHQKNKGYAKLGSNLRKCFQVPKDGDCKPVFLIYSLKLFGVWEKYILVCGADT